MKLGGDAEAVEKLGQGAEFMRQLELGEPAFDGDLPEACGAPMILVAAIPQQCGQRRGQAGCAGPDQSQKDMGVEQRLHASGSNGRRRKSSGSGLSNSSATKATIFSTPRFGLKSLIASSRRPFEDRGAVAGDDDGFAALDLAGELGQTVFRFTDRDRFP
jgi:hypothetical protein